MEITVRVIIDLSESLRGFVEALLSGRGTAPETAAAVTPAQAPAEAPAEVPEQVPAEAPAEETPQAAEPAPAPAAVPGTDWELLGRRPVYDTEAVRAAMATARDFVEGIGWETDTETEGYRKYHRRLNSLFRSKSEEIGGCKPTELPDEEKRAEFCEWAVCLRRSLDGDAVVCNGDPATLQEGRIALNGRLQGKEVAL